jgi:hypothetical protein
VLHFPLPDAPQDRLDVAYSSMTSPMPLHHRSVASVVNMAATPGHHSPL